MKDAIEQRVEEFVQEMLGLIGEVSAERRAAALSAVAMLLAGVGAPPPSKRRPASRADHTAPRTPVSPAAGQGRPRGPRLGAAPAAGAPSISAGAVSGTTASAGAASEPTIATNDREARVLAAARSLGRATASDVAGHTGLPNGSVAVALRALVARGLVVREATGRGVEYGLAVTTAVA